MTVQAAPSLTAFCTKLANSETLVGMVDQMTAKNNGNVDNRAIALSLVIMSAAGDFINGLHRNEQSVSQEMSAYLRETSSDVIAAEAIVWLSFLMGRFWKADQKNDRKMFERVGFVTVSVAGRLAIEMIERHTGVDFTEYAVDRGKFYFQTEKDNTRPMFEPFASVVLSSTGRQSPADPLRSVGPLPPPVWMALSLYVATFFLTMPKGFYETFKRVLMVWPERFPEDDDFFGDE